MSLRTPAQVSSSPGVSMDLANVDLRGTGPVLALKSVGWDPIMKVLTGLDGDSASILYTYNKADLFYESPGEPVRFG